MMVILAHLLTPSEVGLAGLVLVFTVLFQMLADVGLTASLVQFEHLSEGDRSTAFWTGLGVAVVCFGVAVVVAPYVADFYHEPSVQWMFIAVASVLVLGALQNTQAALLTRSMDFRRIEIRGMLATLASAVVGITAAALGAGAWSLIAAAVALTTTSTITIWIVSPWKPHLMFSLHSLRRMASFSTGIFFTRFTYYADQNADNLLVGKFLGSAALGIYTIGYSIILVPFERVVQPVASVIIPAFATLQNDLEGTRSLWLRGQRLIAAVMFPAVAGAIIVAPDFVPVVLGSKWTPAVPIIQILAWVALIQAPAVLNAGLYRSRYRVDLLIRMGILAAVLDIAAFAVGLHWGVRGVAAGYALTNTLVITPLGLLLACRIIGVSFRKLAADIRGIVEATIVMSVVVIGLQRILEVEHVGAGLRLPILIAVGAATYLLMCAWRERELFSELSIRRFAASATV